MKNLILFSIYLLGFTSICTSQISLVKDINTINNPTKGSNANYYDTLGSMIYFAATDTFNNYELWKTDGTSSGTSLAVDIVPGITGLYPEIIKNINGTLYFTAYSQNSGKELYKSDGTANGTSLIMDINPGINSSKIEEIVGSQGFVYFIANDGTHGNELWVTNGTVTHIVKDISPGASSSDIKNLISSGIYLYFTIDNKLYRTSGTTSSTILLHNFGTSKCLYINDKI